MEEFEESQSLLLQIPGVVQQVLLGRRQRLGHVAPSRPVGLQPTLTQSTGRNRANQHTVAAAEASRVASLAGEPVALGRVAPADHPAPAEVARHPTDATEAKRTFAAIRGKAA
jgi:hypothetical protein